MKIDLGNTQKFEVILNGESHFMREPTVGDVRSFQKEQKRDKDNIDAFIDFLDDLGLPREKAEDLGLSKIKTLTDKILGSVEKK